MEALRKVWELTKSCSNLCPSTTLLGNTHICDKVPRFFFGRQKHLSNYSKCLCPRTGPERLVWTGPNFLVAFHSGRLNTIHVVEARIKLHSARVFCHSPPEVRVIFVCACGYWSNHYREFSLFSSRLDLINGKK